MPSEPGFPKEQSLRLKLKCMCFTGEWEPSGVQGWGPGGVKQGKGRGASAEIMGSGAGPCYGDRLLASTESLGSCMK